MMIVDGVLQPKPDHRTLQLDMGSILVIAAGSDNVLLWYTEFELVAKFEDNTPAQSIVSYQADI